MNRYYYDFHIHSCLSPCADNDMTPNNIAGVCALAGLQIAALTDHNSVKNCPAFYKAAKKQGVIPIAGMELTTAEDIHVVCLFEALENAMAFGEAVEEKRIRIKNRVDIFGDQIIMDESDEPVGIEEDMLPNATLLSLDEVQPLVARFDGVCYPAHIDREANGIIAILGTIPESPIFHCVELRDYDKKEDYKSKYPILKDKLMLCGSDAHYLWDIQDASAYFELEDEPYSGDFVRHQLFLRLKGET
ncbi:MAG: PHP domain-containing protein [Ruminococcaceae bacterium]|nr:PHP domain-containing protein [Oscillospiraceae bacterium]